MKRVFIKRTKEEKAKDEANRKVIEEELPVLVARDQMARLLKQLSSLQEDDFNSLSTSEFRKIPLTSRARVAQFLRKLAADVENESIPSKD